MRLGRRSLKELESSASQIVYAVAVLWLGVLGFVLYHGGNLQSTMLNLGVGWGVGTWAVLIYAGLYVCVIYWRYRSSAVWVFGLMLWLADGLPNMLPLALGHLGSRNDTWIEYNIFSAVLFVISALALRNRLSFRLTTGILVVMVALTLLPLPGMQMPSAVPWDLLTISVVFSMLEPPVAVWQNSPPAG